MRASGNGSTRCATAAMTTSRPPQMHKPAPSRRASRQQHSISCHHRPQRSFQAHMPLTRRLHHMSCRPLQLRRIAEDCLRLVAPSNSLPCARRDCWPFFSPPVYVALLFLPPPPTHLLLKVKEQRSAAERDHPAFVERKPNKQRKKTHTTQKKNCRQPLPPFLFLVSSTLSTRRGTS